MKQIENSSLLIFDVARLVGVSGVIWMNNSWQQIFFVIMPLKRSIQDAAAMIFPDFRHGSVVCFFYFCMT